MPAASPPRIRTTVSCCSRKPLQPRSLDRVIAFSKRALDARACFHRGVHDNTDEDAERVLLGGCHCGSIRYAVRGAPFDETVCHCTICRRTSGAAAVAWFTVRKDALTFTSGAPSAYASSEHGTRGFCSRCGSQLTFSSTRYPDDIDVTTATLNDPEQVPPKDHTFTDSCLSWARCEDGLPRFADAREE